LNRGGLGRQELSRWAGWYAGQVSHTSNVDVGQATYPVNRGKDREGRRQKGARDRVI